MDKEQSKDNSGNTSEQSGCDPVKRLVRTGKKKKQEDFSEILNIVKLSLAHWKKMQKRRKYPDYFGEFQEGLYHIIESLPRGVKPRNRDLPSFFNHCDNDD